MSWRSASGSRMTGTDQFAERIEKIRERFSRALSAESPSIDTVIVLQLELDSLYELEEVIRKCMSPSK